jgi:oxygen-dependent protoporphyrinogen oxidase
LHEIARDRGASIRVRLLEASDRLGGNIQTERIGDYLLEGGPDQFVRHKPAVLELIRRLGLDDQLLPVDARSGAPQVVRRGRPVPLPPGCTMLGPPRLLPLWRSPFLSWWGKARISCEPLIAPRKGAPQDESLRSFVTRRFGREPFDRIFEPIIAGIFTADADELSLDMTLPQFLQLERQHGSIVKALRRRYAGGAERQPPARTGACMSLKEGLGQLVRRLASRLPPDWVRTATRVERATLDARTARWRLEIAGREELEADALILACPSHVSSRLLGWDAPLARDLARLEYASCATVNLAYPAAAVGRPLDGFGFFVGRSERLPILACSHVSVKYPDRVPRNRVLLRAFLGGARDPELLDRDDDALVALAHRTLAGLLHIQAEPLFHRIHRFPASMPQYPVGYRTVMQAIVERSRRHPGLALCGGVLGAVGLPDCVASAEAAAASAMQHAESLWPRAARAAIGGLT